MPGIAEITFLCVDVTNQNLKKTLHFLKYVSINNFFNIFFFFFPKGENKIMIFRKKLGFKNKPGKI